MGQVNATICGRQYRLACEDGQEDHLLGLSKELETRIIDLRRKFGEIGDTRLTVMAALSLAGPVGSVTRRPPTSVGSRDQPPTASAAPHWFYEASQPSWPGLSRPSTSSLRHGSEDVDARHKAGHDGGNG